jgi:hypothetical protein
VSTKPKLIKLLETATHPTASEGERLNALNAFRRISDRHGGIEASLSNELGSRRVEFEVAELKRAVAQAAAVNEAMQRERDDALRQLQDLLRKQFRVPDPGKSDSNSRERFLVRGALEKGWQELHRIHEKAKQSGCSHPSSSTQAHLEALVSDGFALFREAGVHRDRSGNTRWRPPAWRTKPSCKGLF